MRTSDLLLHPIRMRVVQCLLGDRRLTTAQLREELPDVAPATLYRQVATLLEGGAIEVVEERRVRAAVERTYALAKEALVVGPEEAAAMSVEEHARGFMAFVAARLSDFDRYLETPNPDLARDRVGYRVAALHLSDEELDGLLTGLAELVRPLAQNRPGPGRRRRILSTILVPGEAPAD